MPGPCFRLEELSGGRKEANGLGVPAEDSFRLPLPGPLSTGRYISKQRARRRKDPVSPWTRPRRHFPSYLAARFPLCSHSGGKKEERGNISTSPTAASTLALSRRSQKSYIQRRASQPINSSAAPRSWSPWHQRQIENAASQTIQSKGKILFTNCKIFFSSLITALNKRFYSEKLFIEFKVRASAFRHQPV